jgi:hypothetical protein
MYIVPHTKGVVGTAANMVHHIADRMAKEGWQPIPAASAVAV